MRRKLWALVCAVILLAQLAPPSAQAAGGVYFTAANETIRELTEATMPFAANGDLYVDGSIFENKDLYTGYFYNATQNKAVVYSRKTANFALYFDLNNNRVDNADGYGYYPPAIARNGTIFLPVGLVTSYFELGYANIRVEYGHLLRIRSDKAVLNDRTLADAGVTRMETQYQQYLADKAVAEQNRPGSSSGAAAGKGQTVHLCFRLQENTEELLDLLDNAGARGTFCLTEEEITRERDLVRRMAATGHGIALLAYGEAETPVEEQLRLANETLWSTAGLKTRLCRLEAAEEEQMRAAEAAGYRCLGANIDRTTYGMKTGSAARYVFDLVSSRSGGRSVWLADGTAAAGLRTFLNLTQQAEDRVLALTETD